jgi:hypothetical protein
MAVAVALRSGQVPPSWDCYPNMPLKIAAHRLGFRDYSRQHPIPASEWLESAQ